MSIAHSSYQYNLLKTYLRDQDIDYCLNQKVRQKVIDGKFYVAKSIRKKFFDRLKKQNALICVYCQNPVTNSKTETDRSKIQTIDHFIPLSDGGYKYIESNFLCACVKCNNKRQSRPSFRISDTLYVF